MNRILGLTWDLFRIDLGPIWLKHDLSLLEANREVKPVCRIWKPIEDLLRHRLGMFQKYTVVGIKEITKDDRKLTRPRLETAQVEDAAISSELHCRVRSP